WKAASMAVTSAADPEAEEARPAAVGKSLSERMSIGGRSKRRRRRARQAVTLRSSIRCPFSWNVSAPLSATVVVVVRVSSVIDSDGTAGTLPGPGALPQYLTRAMFGWACATALTGLTDRRGAV